MSRKNKLLQDALKQLHINTPHLVSGILNNINATQGTCTLCTAEGLLIEGVQLKTLKNNNYSLLLVPQENSWGHALQIGEPDYLLIAADTLDKCLLQTTEGLFQLDDSGFILQHKSESLGPILSDLLNTIMALTVPTNAGPSSIPSNITDFQTIQQRLQNLFS